MKRLFYTIMLFLPLLVCARSNRITSFVESSLDYINDDTKLSSNELFKNANKLHRAIIDYSKKDDYYEYLWMEGDGEFYVNFNNDYCNIEYSFDKETWLTARPTSGYIFSTFIKVPEMTKIYFRGLNGVQQSFWGRDWWGCIRTTTKNMYDSHYDASKYFDDCFRTDDEYGVRIRLGGNVLSLVFGDDFINGSNSLVYSTLSRIFMSNTLFEDASNLYMIPIGYGNNKGFLSSYGNQYGTFQWCHHLKYGPHIKYLSKDLFTDCEFLTELYYEGDGLESDIHWYSNKTSSSVEKLLIHVKKGVHILKMPLNAVLVEDIEENDDDASNEEFGKIAEIVDLGLSVKWSSWNVGASKVADYGGLYGAGDPTGLLTSTNYFDYYWKDGESICGTEYDLAHVKWGDKWQLPTIE